MSKKHLPIIGTSAPTTVYCVAEVEGPGGSLWMDGNQKITWGNGTYSAPMPNAFSIENKSDCPGSTPTCRAACYVEGIKKHASDTYTLYEKNSRAIREIVDGSQRATWAMTVAEWIRDHAPGGFRWHVSGDVYSLEYAEWIAQVAAWSAPVRHWIYTRSFQFVEPLVGVPNLAVNLSCDQDNYQQARDTRRRALRDTGQDLRLCYLTVDGSVPEDLPDGSVIFPDYSLRPRAHEDPKLSPFWAGLLPRERAMLCPVDAFGKSESVRCGTCAKCLT